jgi:hypothetical protein
MTDDHQLPGAYMPQEMQELLAEMNAKIQARDRFLEGAVRGPEPPYQELDPPIVGLVRAINQLPGLYTTQSCGGHEEPLTPVSAPADEWWIGIGLAVVKRGEDLVPIPVDEAWVSFEFLAYVVGHHRVNGADVQLRATSSPPWLNDPGKTLGFVLEGWRRDDHPFEPDDLADHLIQDAVRYYVSLELLAWRGEGDDDPVDGEREPT